MLALCAIPARGQLAISVDEHGKRVFINPDEPAPRRTLSLAGSAVPGTPRLSASQPGGFLGLGTTQPIPKAPNPRLERLVHETAQRHRVDPALVKAVIQAESGWNPTAISPRGALGLMQLVPGTAQRYGVVDAFNPQQNVDGGIRYLRTLLERYNGDLNLSLAAYNAGEHAVDRARGVPNYRETRYYVQKVTDSYFRAGSGRQGDWWDSSRPIYRVTDEKGRVVFTNE
ncbi:MAG: lytic transglycosylase domain-containing protein [Acidobacteria bacterium]|nr:lytic transglycosylase domain-containing protein [Acidobacteriota bacterium]